MGSRTAGEVGVVTTWRYRLDTPFEMVAPELIGIDFSNERITIRHARIRIAASYAWDGCSPSWRLPGGIWLGVPDGPLTTEGKPVTFHATLVHDALCQFRPDIPNLSKKQTVDLFRSMLIESGAPTWMIRLYPWAIDHFGPQNWSK